MNAYLAFRGYNNVSCSYVQAILALNNWTVHCFERRKMEKWSVENMHYYGLYVRWALLVPVGRIVFVDECHLEISGTREHTL